MINLRKRKLKDGSLSLYLDIYDPNVPNDSNRILEFLKIHLKRGDPNNKEKMRTAEKIKAQREIELINDEYDFTSLQKRKASFILYFENYAKTKKIPGKEWSTGDSALKHLKTFRPGGITFKQINKALLNELAEYLSNKTKLKKNSALIYFRMVKTALYKASQDGYLRSDLIRDAKGPQKEVTERDYLVESEIEKLIKTKSDTPDITRAFLFSCFTGLRQSDVRNLKWENINEGMINLQQQKTGGKVSIPLVQTALNIIKPTDNILPLPGVNVLSLIENRTMINRALVKWFKAAEVKKRAYYHMSRHSFAILYLDKGGDIYTLSKLLGHKSIKTTEIYAQVLDKRKKETMNNLPVFEVNQ